MIGTALPGEEPSAACQEAMLQRRRYNTLAAPRTDVSRDDRQRCWVCPTCCCVCAQTRSRRRGCWRTRNPCSDSRLSCASAGRAQRGSWTSTAARSSLRATARTCPVSRRSRSAQRSRGRPTEPAATPTCGRGSCRGCRPSDLRTAYEPCCSQQFAAKYESLFILRPM